MQVRTGVAVSAVLALGILVVCGTFRVGASSPRAVVTTGTEALVPSTPVDNPQGYAPRVRDDEMMGVIEQLCLPYFVRRGTTGFAGLRWTGPLVSVAAGKGSTGILVIWVRPKSEAEKAGLRVGDLILRVNGDSALDERGRPMSIATRTEQDLLRLEVQQTAGRVRTVAFAVEGIPVARQLCEGGGHVRTRHFSAATAEPSTGTWPKGEGCVSQVLALDGKPVPDTAIVVYLNGRPTHCCASDPNGVATFAVPTGRFVYSGYTIRSTYGCRDFDCLRNAIDLDDVPWWYPGRAEGPRPTTVRIAAKKTHPLPPIRLATPIMVVSPQPDEVLRLDELEVSWKGSSSAVRYVVGIRDARDVYSRPETSCCTEVTGCSVQAWRDGTLSNLRPGRYCLWIVGHDRAGAVVTATSPDTRYEFELAGGSPGPNR